MKLLLPWLAVVATMIALDAVWIGVLPVLLFAYSHISSTSRGTSSASGGTCTVPSILTGAFRK